MTLHDFLKGLSQLQTWSLRKTKFCEYLCTKQMESCPQWRHRYWRTLPTPRILIRPPCWGVMNLCLFVTPERIIRFCSNFLNFLSRFFLHSWLQIFNFYWWNGAIKMDIWTKMVFCCYLATLVSLYESKDTFWLFSLKVFWFLPAKRAKTRKLWD